MKKNLLILLVLLMSSAQAHAQESGDPGLLSSAIEGFKKTLFQPTSYDLYIPFWTWHNRLAYSREKCKEYNEHPIGGGIGTTRIIDANTEHSMVFMVFDDSNYYPQGVGAYMWMKKATFGPGFYVAGGAAITLQMRHEYNYIPLPLPLPVVEVGFRRLSIQGAYVPGWKGNGNVLFMWGKFKF